MKTGAYFRYLIILNASIFILAGCNKPDEPMTHSFYKVYGGDDMASLLPKLSNIGIYFGHQSVGYNITEGIEKWSQETGIAVNLVDTRIFEENSERSFIHFRIGKNQDPVSKIDDFASILGKIPKKGSPIAFFKFCYVDIIDTTEVEPLFLYYKEKMYQLRDEYPEVKIVLLTSPYTGIQKGTRALAKRLLFMPLAGELENIKRNDFNVRMLDEMDQDFAIFDLAKVESTLPDGSVNTYKYRGVSYPSLAYEYTDDLGHLNNFGSRIVSYNLIAFLAGEID